jgi:hypothetical protein
MLYFSVILCIRQRFIIVAVYIRVIRGTDTPYVLTFTICFVLMWPSSLTLGLTIIYFLSWCSPQLASVYTSGVRYMYGFMWCPIFRNVLNVEHLKYKNIKVLILGMLKFGLKLKLRLGWFLKYIFSLSSFFSWLAPFPNAFFSIMHRVLLLWG